MFEALDAARAAGARIAFDSNYRPRNWPGLAAAKEAMAAMLRRTDIALCSHNDERLLRRATTMPPLAPAGCAMRESARW